MKQFCLLILLLVLLTLSGFGQRIIWRTTVYTTTETLKGALKEVNDSGVLLATKHGFETILFTQIKSFRFNRIRDDGLEYVSGAIVGAVGGAVIGVNSLTKGRAGEGRAMAGIFGGIGGGIAGAIVGALTAPFVYNWLGSKKIIMVQSPEFYQSLPVLLKPYRRF